METVAAHALHLDPYRDPAQEVDLQWGTLESPAAVAVAVAVCARALTIAKHRSLSIAANSKRSIRPDPRH